MRASVYRMFDAEGRLLYVGMTSKGTGRLDVHAGVQSWWEDVVNVTLEHHPDRRSAELAEAAAIRDEQPRYNVVRYIDQRQRATPRIYARRWHEGSIFQQSRNGAWVAKIRLHGDSHRFYGGVGPKGRARAEAWLAEFIRANVTEAA